MEPEILEPSLLDLLKDPLIEMLMASDRVDPHELHQLLTQVSEHLRACLESQGGGRRFRLG
jgi:hypothetical protein